MSAFEYTVPVVGGWVAVMQWDTLDGVVAGPDRITIKPENGQHVDGGCSQTVLRDIDFKAAVVAARAAKAHRTDIPTPEQSQDYLESIDTRRLTPQYLAHLSNLYVGVAAGVFGSFNADYPVEYVADVVGKEIGATRGNLNTCVKRDYLVRSPGRAGGTLTAKCANTLREPDSD